MQDEMEADQLTGHFLCLSEVFGAGEAFHCEEETESLAFHSFDSKVRQEEKEKKCAFT